MKASQEQLDTQKLQLEELLKRAKFDEVFDQKDYFAQLNMHLTVFGLCMERFVCNGLDEPTETELRYLSNFWYVIKSNLDVSLELLNMASYTANNLKYDLEHDGEFTSLIYQSNGSEQE